jgi:hypothetical protein
MSDRSDVIAKARSQVGYQRKPSRWNKYAAEAYPTVQNQPYCGIFAAWVIMKATGADVRKVVWMPYVPSIEAWARKNGAWKTRGQKDGDLVVFGFGKSSAQHVGFAWRDENSSRYRSVEGNTSPGNSGSQGNGGGVHVRYRSRSQIRGWVDLDKLLKAAGHKPSVGGGGTSAPKPSKPAKSGKVEVDGRLGRETAKEIQRQLNASKKTKRKLTVDGRLGTNTYKSLQEHLGGNVIDGLIENQSYKPTELGNGVGPHGWEYTGRGSKGSATIRRLQRHLGVKDVDGVLFEGTTAAVQRAINQGKL